MRLHLYNSEGKDCYVRLHRLLAQAFIPNPQNLQVVDHKNRNKLDNRLNNLRWVTSSENNRNASGNGEFIDVLPEGCEEFKTYGKHLFTNYFIDPKSKQIYYQIIEQFRVLIPRLTSGGHDMFCLLSDAGKRV